MLNNNKKTDVNECTTRATCSISPSIAALEILAVNFLKEISFYLLELRALGAYNTQIANDIIDIVASLTAVNEYSDNELYDIVVREYFILDEVKTTYIKLCRDRDIPLKLMEGITNFSKETTLAQAISLGEKQTLTDEKTSAKNNLLAILLVCIQSICLNLVQYANYEDFDFKIFYSILQTINILNFKNISESSIKKEIINIAKLDYLLQIRLWKNVLNYFGGISKVNVSHSTRKGKAILVSGNNLSDLYDMLLATKDKNIDVYSHSNLLLAHALVKFKAFEHFQGHYGSLTENCILDYATFPGTILMTKNFRNNTEYLYRGRLFSTDYIVPKGVTKIENNDFTPLVRETLEAKGFSKGKTKENTPLGYNEAEILDKFAQIREGLNNGSISHLYIIGIDALTERNSAYYDSFLHNICDDEFAISFSYNSQKENVLSVNIGNFIPIMSSLLNDFFDGYDVSSPKISFFFTTCDVITISMIVYLSSVGAKNIYMSQCLPTIINPVTFSAFESEYNINITTTAKNDLEQIRKNKAS